MLLPVNDPLEYFSCPDVFHLDGNRQIPGKEEPSQRAECPSQGASCCLLDPKGKGGWERFQVFHRAFPAFPECFAVVHPLQSMKDEDSGVLAGNAKPKPCLTPCSDVSAAEACPGTDKTLGTRNSFGPDGEGHGRILWMPLSIPWQQK